MIRSAPRSARFTFVLITFITSLLLASCASDPQAVELGWTPDSPAVYRVSVSSESRFSGPVSDLSGATQLTTTLRVTPVSRSEAEVEVVYLGASIADASGEAVALSLPDLTDAALTVNFSPPGVVSEVSSDNERGERFLGAQAPLVSPEDVVRSLFPPLPEGSFRAADTWTGGISPPFPGLGEEPVRMRYVVDSVGAEPAISGYELSVSPRDFRSETAGDEVNGEGHLNIEFEGTLDESGGYAQTRRRADFGSDYLRLGGGGYANGTLRLTQETIVERLNAFEQFGLDAVSPE
ncbi:MAG: hypothetical protein ACR2KW_00460 [Rubrobacter sp.]